MASTIKQSLKSIFGVLAVCVAFLAYGFASDSYYIGIKRPDGVLTAADYLRRFGEPRFIRIVERGDRIYYEFNGRINRPWWCLSLPSAAPAYVFDERGTFIDWCWDPGDKSEYRRLWRLKSSDLLEVAEVKRKLGL
jgi:hypothetical protein